MKRGLWIYITPSPAHKMKNHFFSFLVTNTYAKGTIQTKINFCARVFVVPLTVVFQLNFMDNWLLKSISDVPHLN
jgi:hypothetical protein